MILLTERNYISLCNICLQFTCPMYKGLLWKGIFPLLKEGI